jgi:PRTRC genetic system ThiF family protein
VSKVHYIDQYLVAPPHPVTVNVIGAGGNGSQVIQGLARMNMALRALEHPGLVVCLYDDDEISMSNCARQLFSVSDIGKNKAEVLIERINRFYGFNWVSEPNKFDKHYGNYANIFISCVDSADARVQIGNYWHKFGMSNREWEKPLYWLDLGNGNKYGQVILGSSNIQQSESKFETVSQLPTVDEDIDLESIEEDNEPSCSIAESLERQDLFINPIISYYGLNLLWKLFKEYRINHRGYYINLDSGKTNPIHL